MAIVKSVNLRPATGSVAIWQLVYLLIDQAGWTKILDSDGTTFSSSGSRVWSGVSLGNPFAWMVLRSPNGGLYLSIQHSSDAASNNNFRIKVSQQAPVGGSAMQVPTAPDDALVAGGGTDAEPTMLDTVIWEQDPGPTDEGYWAHAVAETTPPYRFVLFAYSHNLVTEYVQTCFFLDAVQPSTLTPGDSFPYVIRASVGGGPYGCTHIYLSSIDGPSTPKTWLAKSTESQGFVFMPMCTLNSDVNNVDSIVTLPGRTAINPLTGVYDLFPVVYNRRSTADAPRGFKGTSSMWAWNPGGQYPDVIPPGDLFSVNGVVCGIALNDLVLTLWPGDIPQGTGRSIVTRDGRLLLGGVVDSVRPIVSNFVPAVGTMIAANTPLQFDVTDNLNQFSSLAIKLSFAGSAPWEIACDGTEFGPNYVDSTRVEIANGFRYVLRRSSGWPSSPAVSVLAVDSSGNEVL